MAFDNAGVPFAVSKDVGGLLTRLFDRSAYRDALKRLITDIGIREQMGAAARKYVEREHDRAKNYGVLEAKLQELIVTSSGKRSTQAKVI